MAQAAGDRFFFLMALVLIALVITGFTLGAFARPGGIAAVPLFLHFHGGVFFAWFVLFATQAYLMNSGNVTLHKQLGAASIFLAVTMVILGFIVTKGAYAKPEWSIAGRPAAGSALFPFTDIVNFIIAYTLGVLNRRNGAAHKRFMLLAGILIIDPAVGRLVYVLGGQPLLILLIEGGLVAALIGYDLRKLKRPHWASLVGAALFVAAMTAKMTLAEAGWWKSFADNLFG